MCTLINRVAGGLCTRALKYKFKNALPILNNSSRNFSVYTVHLASRKFTDKHEWISLEGKIGTVGISHYAQDSLGDVVYVHTPEIGQVCEQDGEVGVIESVKAVNEIYSPVSGTVVEANEQLVDKPGLINESCYDKGWIYKLELSNIKELDSLMNEEAYEKYVKTIHV